MVSVEIIDKQIIENPTIALVRPTFQIVFLIWVLQKLQPF